MTKAYETKDLNQWTPADVAEAIADGYDIVGQARARALLNNAAEEPETLRYLQNREKRLTTVMHNIAAIGKYRGVHPIDVANQYGPELWRVRAEIIKRLKLAA